MFSFQCEIILLKWISIYRTALLLAIQNGYMDLSEKLIDSASNLNLQDANGRYAYVYVIYQSIDFITKSLWKPRTALHLAIENGYVQLAEKLIESGANLDLQDSRGR